MNYHLQILVVSFYEKILSVKKTKQNTICWLRFIVACWRIQEQEIKQKNEGGYYEFIWDEDMKPGYLSLEMMMPKHLDSNNN
jgi:hypothetical protein